MAKKCKNPVSKNFNFSKVSGNRKNNQIPWKKWLLSRDFVISPVYRHFLDSKVSGNRKMTKSFEKIIIFKILRNSASSFHWLSSSIFSYWLSSSSRIGDISSNLHYMMFPSIQTIHFLWGYDPGNVSASYSQTLHRSIWVSHSCKLSSLAIFGLGFQFPI